MPVSPLAERMTGFPGEQIYSRHQLPFWKGPVGLFRRKLVKCACAEWELHLEKKKKKILRQMNQSARFTTGGGFHEMRYVVTSAL